MASGSKEDAFVRLAAMREIPVSERLLNFIRRPAVARKTPFVRLAAMREIPVSERFLNFIRRPAAGRKTLLSGWQ